MAREKLLTFFLLFLIFAPLGKTIWGRKDYYYQPFDLERARHLYEISQYVKEEGASWIPDEILFAYAGWDYINGGNPILLNPENPPLGKYLVGLSIKLFNNEKIPTLLFGFLSLFSLFLLSRLFLKKAWLALIPAVIFAWERLFQEQFLYLPLFELFALAFLNFSLYFFIKAEKNNRYFLASNFFLGTLWAIRPWMATVPLLVAWVVYLLFIQKSLKRLFFWLITTPMAVTVLLLSYLRLFLEGWSVYKVLSVQKWILWYHQSRLIEFGSVWPLIYLNRWYVWWGDKPYLLMVQWNIFWPVFTSLALVFSGLVFIKTAGLAKTRLKNFKFDQRITVLSLWLVFYIMFLSIGNISSRYLFYLLPYCYLLGVYFLTYRALKGFKLKKLRQSGKI